MWDYSYIVPSLLVLTVLSGYYFALPRLPVRKNRIFIYLITVELLVTLLDMISSWADMNYQAWSVTALYLLNGAYFVFFFMRSFAFFLFTASILRADLKRTTLWTTLMELPLNVGIILTLLSPFTHWIFYIDENGYNSGILYNSLYVIAIIYLGMSFGHLAFYMERLRRRRERNSAIWFNVAILIGLILRYVFPSYLLMDTFCVIAIMIIYLSYENPDFYLEGRSWIYNSQALREYLGEFNRKKRMTIFAFGIQSYKDMREIYGVRQMDQGINLIGNYLKKTWPKKRIFYFRSGRFVMLGDESTQWDEVFRTLIERFEEPWKADDAELYLEIGAGIIDFDNTSVSFEILLKLLSDSFALIEESDGKELLLIGKTNADKTMEETDIKKALEYAIDHDNVEIYLQPIVESKTRKLVGAEALSRIKDSCGNIILPAQFIPIAERNGRINQLGEQMFEKTCKFLKESDIKAMGLTFVNVNLSPIQFMRSDLDKKLTDLVNQYGVDPEFIHLEITEEAMVDEQFLEKQMYALSEKGFKFALDDYGKGYSNMKRMRKCPFINVKLDMSIVWDYCKTPDELLPNMVMTFENMGFEITAEGIEDEEMANKMAGIGCTYLQGYNYSKPLCLSDFVKMFGV